MPAKPDVEASRQATESTSARLTKPTRTRIGMLLLVLMATTVNYVGRSNLSIVAKPVSSEFHLNPVQMGHLFSAFAWSYALATIAGGFLVDRLGARLVYGLAQFSWSAATFALAFAGGFSSLFGLRLLVGLTESPAFPANNRVVTLWFPQRERGKATGTYVMGQYIGTALLTPLLAWMAVRFGWRSVFLIIGAVGILGSLVWLLFYRDPLACKWMNQAELDKITNGGALVHGTAREKVQWSQVRQLCLERQIWAICIGKFAIMSALYFLLTWFPAYLQDQRHMTVFNASFATTLPYLAATIGVFIGGSWSDWLLRRGMQISPARKIPIVSGFLGATSMVLANRTSSNSLALAIFTVAFFAQGISSTSWAIIAEVAPRKLVGLTGGICNFAGNLAGIVTPTVIGHILQATGSFARVLVFVACTGVVGALSYTVLIGRIHRIELNETGKPI